MWDISGSFFGKIREVPSVHFFQMCYTISIPREVISRAFRGGNRKKKKVLSLLLAVVMTFSLAVTANAAEETAQDLDGDIVILHTPMMCMAPSAAMPKWPR